MAPPPPLRFVTRQLACVTVVGGLMLPAPVPAQDRNATLTGVVVSVPDGRPLLGAQVLMAGSARWTLSDAEGFFRITGLERGFHIVEVKHPEGVSTRFSVGLDSGATVEIVVRLQSRDVVSLPGVVVEAEAPEGSRYLAGFRRRLADGGGFFITREEIERRDPRSLSDMLRLVPGLRIDCATGGCRVWTFNEARRLASRCPIQYFLDGVHFEGDIDRLTPDQVEGVEVYRGAARVPPEFNTGSAMCGVILIWTREPPGT